MQAVITKGNRAVVITANDASGRGGPCALCAQRASLAICAPIARMICCAFDRP